jgi:ABC-type spermidine/putrescine transport system permease subunit II
VTSVRILDRLFSIAGVLVTAVIGLLLLLPAALISVLSFSSESFIKFPPTSWSLANYKAALAEAPWLEAAWQSLLIGGAAAGLAVLLALPALLAIHRSTLPGRQLIEPLAMGTLVIPSTAYAVAMYGFFASSGLLGTKVGITIAHAMLGLPLALIVMSSALRQIPQSLEMVAMSLGASRRRAWMSTLAPLLVPSILAGFILAFVQSFDEVVFVVFLSGPGINTLPKAIFDSLRFGVDSVPTAISTLMIVLFTLLLVASTLLRRRRRRS